MIQDEINAVCMEDQLRSLGILKSEKECSSNLEKYYPLLKGINLEAATPTKKIRATVLSMEPSEAVKLLEPLLAAWQSRSSSGKYVLPWIYNILVNHGHNFTTEEFATCMLDSLYKITNSRGPTFQSLLQLSGRLQLMTSQIDKASQTVSHPVHDLQIDESGDEDEEDEYFHDEGDDDSEISSDDES
ncbi:hypothetical protein Ahy_A01g001022 isoform C [Arachis hypogaea]|uniref:Small-subunit processome Utp12 domain-containing protein n=1 Tax=Arachis hypogaea TaxID=3818 RepID=A0A445ELV1_ARAHY|nr:hypothetical protein Ahy_A01g001022 isoform C [Arachis hypogaea]